MTNGRVAACVKALRAGRPVLVSDDADRENETDLVLAAEACTEEQMAFVLRHTSGFVCCAMTRARAEALSLPPMVARNEDAHGTAFAVSCDAVDTGTGISASARAATCRALARAAPTPDPLRRPGHVLPLVARDGGVRERRGHTEASVDLCRLAGLQPCAVLCEVTTPDKRGMASAADATRLAREHDLAWCSVSDVVDEVSQL